MTQMTKAEQAELHLINAEIARKRPWEFVHKFAYTLDEHDIDNPIKLFPDKLMYRIVVRAWEEYPILFIEKSRQIMMTWLMSILLLWDAMFRKGRKNFLQSKKQDDADAIVDRATHVYRQLAERNFPGLPKAKDGAGRVGTESKLEFPDTMSWLWAVPQGPDTVRSYTPSNVLADEVAYQAKARKGYEAVLPAVKGGGHYIAQSSANGKVFNYNMLYSINPNTGKPTGPNLVDSTRVLQPRYTVEQLERMNEEEFYAIPFEELVACVPGMRFWVTDLGVPCLRVHYSADPDKSPETERGRAWIVEAKKGSTPDGWEREMEINYDTFEGKPVITNWDRTIFVKRVIYDSELPIHIGVDFGTTICGGIFCQVDRIQGFSQRQVRILHEVILRGGNTAQLIEDLIAALRLRYHRTWESRNLYCHCDPAGNQQRETTSDKSVNTSIKLMRAASLPVTSKMISIRESTDLVKTVFAMSTPKGDPCVIVDPSCEYTIKVLGGGWHYPENSQGRPGLPEKDDEFDHGGDMLRYNFSSMISVADILGAKPKLPPAPTPIREEFTGRIIGYRSNQRARTHRH